MTRNFDGFFLPLICENTEIRMTSVIRTLTSMGLPLARTRFFIDIRTADKQDFVNAITEFLETCHYRDSQNKDSTALKDLIKRMVADAVDIPAVRDLVVLWWAQQEAPSSCSKFYSMIIDALDPSEDSLVFGAAFNNPEFEFALSDISYSSLGRVGLTVGKDFVHTSLEGREVSVPLLAQLLHELGHHLDTQRVVLDRGQAQKDPFITPTFAKLAAELQDVSVNSQKFNELSLKNHIMLDVMQKEFRQNQPVGWWSRAKSFAWGILHRAEDPLVDKIACGQQLTPEETGKFLWHNLAEFTRITGLRLFKQEATENQPEKMILVVDPRSDLGLASILNFPWITSHLGFPGDHQRKNFDWINIQGKYLADSWDNTYNVMRDIYLYALGTTPEQAQQNNELIMARVPNHVMHQPEEK